VLTHRAVAAGDDEDVSDLAQAPTWGLMRTAQTEHPGRFIVLDVDDHDASWQQLPTAVATALSDGEPQLAVRRGEIRAPRLVVPSTSQTLIPPTEQPTWRLAIPHEATGSLDDLAFAACPEAARPLAAGEVRLEVRAAGLNFRDVLIALGMVDVGDPLGLDAAGVVVEVGPGVTTLTPGDRAMGLVPGSMGPLAIADHRFLTPIPEGWTFTQAATVPAAFLTAWHALIDVAGLEPGETVLVHAATGGLGMAAVQLARHLGAEVYATAHPDKWAALRALGVPHDHIASSRTPDFEQRFRKATNGRGVDVILHSLTGELTDASLRLLTPTGRLIDLGKTDNRDPQQVAADYCGARYQEYHLTHDTNPDAMAQSLTHLSALFSQGTLDALPVTAVDIRHAAQAFQLMRDAKHVGKIVLTIPHSLDPDGTVLITGGTGTLGGLLARHLAARHHARNLVLVSRRGPHAPGATELQTELQQLGAVVTIAACDTADRGQLAALLESIPAEHPLTAVIHAAGTAHPGYISALTSDQLDTVLRPKVDAAWNLHRLTRHHDLSAFVLFSSSAGIIGIAEYGNYAAANTFLDALAHHRRHHGMPAISVAWGMWAEKSGLTTYFTPSTAQHIARAGFVSMPTPHALDLFDAALNTDRSYLVPALLDLRLLSHHSDTLAPPLRGLVTPHRPDRTTDMSLTQRLAGLSEPDQHRVLEEILAEQVGEVLRSPADQIDRVRPLNQCGLDSLTAIELRNRMRHGYDWELNLTQILGGANIRELAAECAATRNQEETPA
jgi:NADPH:quinone reductase-like Zn-dependent oxidoreductase/aryl carrier-like protein